MVLQLSIPSPVPGLRRISSLPKTGQALPPLCVAGAPAPVGMTCYRVAGFMAARRRCATQGVLFRPCGTLFLSFGLT